MNLFSRLSHQKYISIFLFIVLVITLTLNFYIYRSPYVTGYDSAYQQDRYDHSQWIIPNSSRTVDDANIYRVAGKKIVETGNFFQMNAEVPPLAKMFFGFTEKMSGNPYYANIPILLTVLLLTYLISRKFLNLHFSQAALIILALEPLFFSQQKVTLLDMSQLMFFLLHVYFALTPIRYRINVLLAGITLGLFTATKFGLFAIPILFVDLFFIDEKLFYLQKSTLENSIKNNLGIFSKMHFNKFQVHSFFYRTSLLVSGILLGFLSAYGYYFYKIGSFADWWTAIKWMIQFYRSSNADPLPAVVFFTMLFGTIRGWGEGASWSQVSEWVISWPIYLFFVGFGVKRWESLDTKVKYLVTLVGTLISTFMFIPFFARYLLLILPLMIVLSLYLFQKFRPKKIKSWIFVLIILIYSVQVFRYASHNPAELAQALTLNLKSSTYQDLYELLTEKSKAMSRDIFWKDRLELENKLNLIKKDVTVTPSSWWPWNTSSILNYDILYETPIGKFSSIGEMKIKREMGVWRLEWDDNYLIEGVENVHNLRVNFDPPHIGKLITPHGKILTQGGEWSFVTFHLSKAVDEQRAVSQIMQLLGLSKFEVEWKYKANWPRDWPVKLGFLPTDKPQPDFDLLSLDPGIVIDRHITRTYDEEVLKRNLLDEAKKIEEKYPQLKSELGGAIKIVLPNGNETVILTHSKSDGIDIVLTENESKPFINLGN